MRTRLVSIVVVTAIEAPSVYMWLRLHESGHDWWGFVILAAGETLETALALRLVSQSGGRELAAAHREVAATHLRGLRLQVGAGCAAEIAIWVLWLALADEVGQLPAAVVLLVLMHLKHHAEMSAVHDTPYTTGLFAGWLNLASAMEAAGAVACLALLRDGRPVLAAVAWVIGLSIEHTVLVNNLQQEMASRDVRLPREVHA
jgi:hypothetical protein